MVMVILAVEVVVLVEVLVKTGGREDLETAEADAAIDSASVVICTMRCMFANVFVPMLYLI